MNKTKFDKLFKKHKSKKSLSNKSSDKPHKKRAQKKERSNQEDKALIESIKTSISRELNDKDTAKKAALIIEEMLKSKKKK